MTLKNTLKNFESIKESAIRRKGSEENLALLVGDFEAKPALTITDHRALACFAKCIFQAGFAWRVIEQKWPGFETAFWGFEPNKLVRMSPDQVDSLCQDTRIVRNRQKILATLDNARLLSELNQEYGSFGELLDQWPKTELCELYLLLKKRGARLGGMTGPRALRYMGVDNFLLTRDVIGCLRDAGLELSQSGQSNSDLRKAQAAFNLWQEESGLAYWQLSRIAAFSFGDNH